MTKPFDCIIVGAGIIGASCFYRLTEAGKRCLLIEEKQLGAGITGASGCIVRVAHGSQEAIAAAAMGFHFYQALSRESAGRVPFTRTGYLHFATQDALLLMQARMEQEGIRAELLSGETLRSQYPGFPVVGDVALYEPDSGYMEAKPTLEYLVQSAVARGGVYNDAVTVQALNLDTHSNRVTGIVSSIGEFSAPNVVLAMGNGTTAFLSRMFDDACGMWNQHIQVTRFTRDEALPSAPCFIDDINELNGRWCPLTGGFFAGHPTGRHVPAGQAFAAADRQHAELTQRLAQRRFPWLEGASATGALSHSDCYSEQPIGVMGEQPGMPAGMLIASGFSGGGFKMAPYVASQILQSINNV